MIRQAIHFCGPSGDVRPCGPRGRLGSAVTGCSDFVQWKPPAGDDSTLGIVDFSICPHLAQEGMPGNSMTEAEQWAAGISGPAYAMDDETAIKVVDGIVEVVSEGQWKLFP